MAQLFSVEQIANQLGLQARTVRTYVRDGKLKAVRIGKQYRIAGEDLAALTGRSLSALEVRPVPRHRHVEVSSIVEIDAISPESANRITNLLTAGAKGQRPDDEPLRIETIYNQERAHLKVILVGSMQTNAALLNVLKAVLES